MGTKHIIEKMVDGKRVYECSGDFDGTLNVAESDPLFDQISEVINNAEAAARRLIEERDRKRPGLVDSLLLKYGGGKNAILSSRLPDGAAYATDFNGMVVIGGWMVIVDTADGSNGNDVNLLVYNPKGDIRTARFITFPKYDTIQIDIIRNPDESTYVVLQKFMPAADVGVVDDTNNTISSKGPAGGNMNE